MRQCAGGTAQTLFRRFSIEKSDEQITALVQDVYHDKLAISRHEKLEIIGFFFRFDFTIT